MFGFGNSEEKKDKAKQMRNGFAANAMIRTFGTSDPNEINEILRTYMPEITRAILGTEAQTSHLTKDHADILISIDEKHDEMMKNTHEMMAKLDSLEQQNKELQEKYNAMVERMARYIEKENGKGR